MTDASPLAQPLILAIRGYQRWISPLLPPVCRFYPSCSAYAIDALRVHGPIRGIGLAVWRLLRCHPWHPGGLDPVPPRRGSGPVEPTDALGRTDPAVRTEPAVTTAAVTPDSAAPTDPAGPDVPAPEERAPC